MTTMPPRFTTSTDTGNVDSPGCSKTKSTFVALPLICQIAEANFRASFIHVLNSGELTFGSCPQQLKFLRLRTPLAPSWRTKSVLSSSEKMPMAVPPDVAQSGTAIEPRPPDAPQTSTLWPG